MDKGLKHPYQVMAKNLLGTLQLVAVGEGDI